MMKLDEKGRGGVAFIDRVIREMLRLVDGQSRPNFSALHLALRELDNVKLNLKLNGYLLAQQMASVLPVREGLVPLKIDLKSKPSTQDDMETDWFAYWMSQLKVPMVFHRKLWEFGFASQSLWQCGMLSEGRRGLGFGCGTEPLASLFANMGAQIVVTDLAHEQQVGSGWTATNQHTDSLEAAYHPNLIDRETFERRVSLQYVDMRRIDPTLRDFDFCWSICAMEHLGSIKAGLEFVQRSLDTLKPGGISVHTTEFNFANNSVTLDNWPTVLFQRGHFAQLAEVLTRQGHWVAPLDFDVGKRPLDCFIDMPPYEGDVPAEEKSNWPPAAHLKLSIDGFASTCFGLLVKKSGVSPV